MRRNSALANVDFPIWKELAQMVVRPAVAEPELEYVPIQAPDKVGSQVEAGALSLQAADKTVEPAQDDQAAMPACSRNRLTSASAALN